MLTFDISAIDIVLLVAVALLILLFFGQQKDKTLTESQLSLKSPHGKFENAETRVESKSDEHDKTQPSLGFTKCKHDLGYLRTLPHNAPVPDECFVCPTVMRCLFPKAQTQQVQ